MHPFLWLSHRLSYFTIESIQFMADSTIWEFQCNQIRFLGFIPWEVLLPSCMCIEQINRGQVGGVRFAEIVPLCSGVKPCQTVLKLIFLIFKRCNKLHCMAKLVSTLLQACTNTIILLALTAFLDGHVVFSHTSPTISYWANHATFFCSH